MSISKIISAVKTRIEAEEAQKIGTESVNLLRKGNLFVKLHNHAKTLLKSLNAQHVVFGVERCAKGQLRTFFIPMTDEELNAHELATRNYINAVHA